MDIATGAQLAGAASNVVGNLMNIGAGKRQHKRQKELMDISMKNQQQLNREGHEMQFDMWNKTNASAQVKHYQDAGLNAGLMYGGSGSGGATTGSIGAGAAASGNAVAETPINGSMEISNSLAQQEVMAATAEKLRAEAENLRGLEREKGAAEIGNKVADTSLKQLQAANQEILNTVGSRSMEDVIGTIEANYKKAEGEAAQSITKARVDTASEKSDINLRKQEAINTMLQAGAIKAGIQLTKEQAKKITDDITQGYINAYSNQRNANSNEQNADTQVQKQIKDAIYQSGILEQGDRKLTQDMILGIGNILGKGIKGK